MPHDPGSEQGTCPRCGNTHRWSIYSNGQIVVCFSCYAKLRATYVPIKHYVVLNLIDTGETA